MRKLTLKTGIKAVNKVPFYSILTEKFEVFFSARAGGGIAKTNYEFHKSVILFDAFAGKQELQRQ
ncbi:hypothetical protein [Pedobacter sp. SYSU D00535]|uniref:hypothetical protein n=1 Tax=Pedobacter sp. SYSU D00535 TaxID=2810308 RepID=UPI001A97492F|nr:hypothetical protein [Pedobacter sp. SYSU D00535]